MKTINVYLKEGLRINKNTSFKKQEYSDEELSNPKFYITCEIPDLDDKIDKILNNTNSDYIPFKKRKTAQGNNMNWYRFYCYLYYNGPSKRIDVVKGVKGDTNSQYAEMFTDLKKYNICSSQKGLFKTEDPEDWKIN